MPSQTKKSFLKTVPQKLHVPLGLVGRRKLFDLARPLRLMKLCNRLQRFQLFQHLVSWGFRFHGDLSRSVWSYWTQLQTSSVPKWKTSKPVNEMVHCRKRSFCRDCLTKSSIHFHQVQWSPFKVGFRFASHVQESKPSFKLRMSTFFLPVNVRLFVEIVVLQLYAWKLFIFLKTNVCIGTFLSFGFAACYCLRIIACLYIVQFLL